MRPEVAAVALVVAAFLLHQQGGIFTAHAQYTVSVRDDPTPSITSGYDFKMLELTSYSDEDKISFLLVLYLSSSSPQSTINCYLRGPVAGGHCYFARVGQQTVDWSHDPQCDGHFETGLGQGTVLYQTDSVASEISMHFIVPIGGCQVHTIWCFDSKSQDRIPENLLATPEPEGLNPCPPTTTSLLTTTRTTTTRINQTTTISTSTMVATTASTTPVTTTLTSTSTATTTTSTTGTRTTTTTITTPHTMSILTSAASTTFITISSTSAATTTETGSLPTLTTSSTTTTPTHDALIGVDEDRSLFLGAVTDDGDGLITVQVVLGGRLHGTVNGQAWGNLTQAKEMTEHLCDPQQPGVEMHPSVFPSLVICSPSVTREVRVRGHLEVLSAWMLNDECEPTAPNFEPFVAMVSPTVLQICAADLWVDGTMVVLGDIKTSTSTTSTTQPP